jgi:hypothetical protein
MRHLLLSLTLCALSVALSTGAEARGRPFHKAPFDFLFGNHIDTHQETNLRLARDGSPAELFGRFYIIFTGATDPVSGLPVARHPRGAGQMEECGVDPVDCVVGWHIRAVPGEAKFLFHGGVNGDDHPVWLLNRADIPQPGGLTHFHWITSASNQDPRATGVPPVCDQNDAGGLEAAGAANTVCPGWFLEIRAVKQFAFEHGGEIIPVRPGIDNATHLNLLTNYQALSVDIEPTR